MHNLSDDIEHDVSDGLTGLRMVQPVYPTICPWRDAGRWPAEVGDHASVRSGLSVLTSPVLQWWPGG